VTVIAIATCPSPPPPRASSRFSAAGQPRGRSLPPDLVETIFATEVGTLQAPALLRSSTRREAEILVLRHHLNVLKRQAPKRPALSNLDRLLFVWLSRLVTTTLKALK
jgi:hypothetical protein